MFKAWPKIPRLENEVYYLTEKIDGTNACIIIDYTGNINHDYCLYSDNINGTDIGIRAVYAQSRTRLITPAEDNFGFAKWVKENAEQLINDLGEGYHFGEWWGQGINRGYGLDHKKFSLFNPTKKSVICNNVPHLCICEDARFLTSDIEASIKLLKDIGSVASPGYMKPEGIVVYAEKAKTYWKVIIDK